MAGIFVDSLFDAVLDCLKVVPILFLAYLLVSFLSHDHSHKFGKLLAKNNKTSVLFASFLGCVPQCGFSSVMADLYSQKRLSLGTLIAVFIATSDEAIPIMVSNTDRIVDLLILIAIKIGLAIFWGYLIDLLILLFGRKNKSALKVTVVPDHAETEKCEHEHEEQHAERHEHEEHAHHNHAHDCGHIHTDACDDDCGHGKCCVNNVFLDAFNHTFSIMIYIFVATFLLNLVIGYFGIEVLESLLSTNVYLQVVFASLIGLIPNCASSVLLVELFIFGSLSFPALIAGLTSGAGVGLVILWTKNKKHPLQNLGILLLLYVIGVASGMFLTLFL